MICTNCKKKPATVHFQSVINGKSTQMDVCPDCARQLSLPFESIFQFPSMSPALEDLFGILSQLKGPSSAAVVKQSCPKCGWTLAQFQKTGRMGCPDCYAYFEEESSNIIKKVQGQISHKGKKIKTKEKKVPVTDLKAQLAQAVKEEKFEWAAELRDKIKKYED